MYAIAPVPVAMAREDDDAPLASVVPLDTDLVPITSASVESAPPTATLAIAFDNSSPELSPRIQRELLQQGFLPGLVRELGRSKALFPLRFWIVDNSGSMSLQDGRRLEGGGSDGDVVSSPVKVVPCSRWAELQSTVNYHINMADLLKLPTIVQFLNPPSSGPQEFALGVPDHAASHSLSDALQQNWNIPMLSVADAMQHVNTIEPDGVTPLTAQILVIRTRLESVAYALKQLDQQAVIVICTDGLPTNAAGETTVIARQEFVKALKSLETLPVGIVIRLCTNVPDVVDFYNRLDNSLNVSMEVLDDYLSEANEVYPHNKWLNYGLPLHRCREMGMQHRSFDLLDEQQLSEGELMRFLRLLFGGEDIKADQLADWNGFVQRVSLVSQSYPKLYHPNKCSMDYWIDTRQLDQAYRRGDECCPGFCCGYCDSNEVLVDDKQRGPAANDGCCMCDLLECFCCLCDCDPSNYSGYDN